MKMIDTHAHYDDAQYDADRDAVLAGAKEAGVGAVICAASDYPSNEKIRELMQRYDFLYGSVGIHPNECYDVTEEEFARLLPLLDEDKVLFVGEIGLDYHYPDTQKDLQKKWFLRQIELAAERGFPVEIHSRDAAADTLDYMREAHRLGVAGDIHCFSYGVEIAREYLNMGYYLGIGGVATFKNAKKLKEVIAYAPLTQLLLETDAPYLAPEPYRGKRNTSAYLPYVVDAISEIKGIAKEEVIETTTENAKRLFGARLKDTAYSTS